MPVTVSSDEDYTIWVDHATSTTTSSVIVKWGSTPATVWSWAHEGPMTLHNDLVSNGPFVFEARVSSGDDMMTFEDSGSARVAAVDYDGRWICDSDEGIAVGVETAFPTDSPMPGTTRMYYSGGNYYVLGFLGGGWRKFPLPY